jgi:DNA-binding NtrC family response regulator
MHERILVIDDEEHMLALFESVLGKEGYVVEGSGSAEDALHLLETKEFDLIVSDLLLPGLDGLALLRQVKGIRPTLPYILLTGHGTVRSAVEAKKEGATDYLTKPVDTDELKMVIANALELHRLTREIEQLRARVANGRGFPHIIGQSKPMQASLRLVDLVAGSDATVLLQGESGTGKELIARAIPDHSARRERPFVILDCGTVPESLLESELFGYTKGAFTGAGRHQHPRVVGTYPGECRRTYCVVGSADLAAAAGRLRKLLCPTHPASVSTICAAEPTPHHSTARRAGVLCRHQGQRWHR